MPARTMIPLASLEVSMPLPRELQTKLNPDSPGDVHHVPCNMCGSRDFKSLYHKESSRDEVFQLVKCRNCGLVQVGPQPDLAAVAPYYKDTYFEKRSDRGYANYYSPELKAQINHVYGLNLHDLKFNEFEDQLLQNTNGDADLDAPRCLDAGCAAGYFVEYMRSRGWQARGVELSAAAANYGREHLGLDILEADFLTCTDLQPDSFDMLSFWASIEHMHDPRRVLERCFELLKPGGRLLLSTCRYGLLARLRGKDWRYMNVPEHLYFFSLPGLINLAKQSGLGKVAHITYGSGLTAKPGAGVLYRAAKKIMDPLVKWTGQGDMMALHFQKDV